MRNIKFNYLYRDGGNYKQFGNVIFSNSNKLKITEVENSIKGKLIDQEFFDAKKWNLPALFFSDASSNDHKWHEFESLEFTQDKNAIESIEEFLLRLDKF